MAKLAPTPAPLGAPARFMPPMAAAAMATAVPSPTPCPVVVFQLSDEENATAHGSGGPSPRCSASFQPPVAVRLHHRVDGRTIAPPPAQSSGRCGVDLPALPALIAQIPWARSGSCARFHGRIWPALPFAGGCHARSRPCSSRGFPGTGPSTAGASERQGKSRSLPGAGFRALLASRSGRRRWAITFEVARRC